MAERFLYHWVPYKLVRKDNDWAVSWLDLGNGLMDEPFFDETTRRCRIQMKNRSKFDSQSDIWMIHELAEQLEYVAPTAFIFHVSRCGSTLLSQCLATQKENIVVAEAPILDEVLRMDEQYETVSTDKENLFRATVKILGQKRIKQQQLFIKLDSWHIHFYESLRKWYPDTPFYFLTREPKAVIQSHRKRRGIHAIPGMVHERWLNLAVSQNHFENFDLFTADVLQGFYARLSMIYRENHAGDYFFDYSAGPEALFQDFIDRLSIKVTSAHEIRERMKFHGKYPDQPFKEELTDWLDFPYTECLNTYVNFINLQNV